MVGERIVRTFVTFSAAFEDDAVYASELEIIAPAGKNVATAIGQGLVGLGYSCSQPTQHSYYGWSFNVRIVRQCFWLLLQGGDPWLLICHQERTFFERLLRKFDYAIMRSFLTDVNNILNDDERFTKVQWWSREDFEANRDNAARESPL